ncbi:MAG TPA: hypothetical protein VGI23_26590 [Steroidobacteraceae bacterium]
MSGQLRQRHAAGGQEPPRLADPLLQDVLMWAHSHRLPEDQREVMWTQSNQPGELGHLDLGRQVQPDVVTNAGELPVRQV